MKEQVRDGDEEGSGVEETIEDFEALFRDRYRTIMRFILQRVDDRELAEDLSAEVFARALEKHRLGAEITLRWMIATARNLVGNEYQRRTSERERIRRVLLEEVLDAGDDGGFEAVEVRFAVTRLRPLDALAVQLTYWDGLPAAEAAEVIGCSKGALWVRLTRARAALRAFLTEGHSLESAAARPTRGDTDG